MPQTIGAIVVDHDAGPLLARCVSSLLADGVARVVVVENGAAGSVEGEITTGPLTVRLKLAVGPALGLMPLTAGACANAVPGSSRHIKISQPAAVALWRRRGLCVPFSPDGFLRPFFRRFFGSSPCPEPKIGVATRPVPAHHTCKFPTAPVLHTYGSSVRE